MKAAGGELGWLTWSPNQGDRSGVSMVLFASPPAPTFPVVGICPRTDPRGENLQERTHSAVRRTFYVILLKLLPVYVHMCVRVHMWVFYKIGQFKPS